MRLLTLAAAALLPVMLVVCAAAVLSVTAHGGYGLGYDASRWLANGLYVLAAALVLRLGWAGLSAFRATRAAAVRGAAARLAERVRLPGGQIVFVLPVGEPLAYTTGLVRPQVVVSRGLLDALDAEERRALLAHELAHARGGHQRMLFVGGVVARALGFVPPVRNALASLTRHLEAAADARAVAAVGDPAIVWRAIATAALASAPAGGAPAVAGANLRERLELLERLGGSPSPSPPATLLMAAGGAVVAAALVGAGCLALHVGPLFATVLLCLALLAALALPPLIRRRVVVVGVDIVRGL